MSGKYTVVSLFLDLKIDLFRYSVVCINGSNGNNFSAQSFRISKEVLENKTARLQNETFIFLYIKLIALLVSIVFLILNVI